MSGKQQEMCSLKLLLLLMVASVNTQYFEDVLRISVYYEALCPDSIDFVAKQLYPTYKKIGDYLLVDFVPYGFATNEIINNTVHFECQHGPPECYSNMAQACTLDQYLQKDAVMEYVNCVMSAKNPASTMALKKCDVMAGVQWNAVSSCMTNGRGTQLLIAYGERTQNVVPKIKFIPTIIFNGVYDESLQDGAIKNLLKTACRLLEGRPEKCPKYYENSQLLF